MIRIIFTSLGLKNSWVIQMPNLQRILNHFAHALLHSLDLRLWTLRIESQLHSAFPLRRQTWLFCQNVWQRVLPGGQRLLLGIAVAQQQQNALWLINIVFLKVQIGTRPRSVFSFYRMVANLRKPLSVWDVVSILFGLVVRSLFVQAIFVRVRAWWLHLITLAEFHILVPFIFLWQTKGLQRGMPKLLIFKV